MSNFHTKEWMLSQLQGHWDDAKQRLPENAIIGVFYYGSGNYGLDYEGSDVDSKCIFIAPPTIKRLPLAVREDGTTIAFTNIHEYIKMLISGNSIAMDILFAEASIINPIYAPLWNQILEEREIIPTKCGAGIYKGLLNSYKHSSSGACAATGHPKWIHLGHHPKALSHACRIAERIVRIHNGESWKETMVPSHPEFHVRLKREGCPLDEARQLFAVAQSSVDEVMASADMTVKPDFKYFSKFKEVADKIGEIHSSLEGDTTQ